ncbi:hypothetical protein [Rhabdaerophilum sp. SD176]|uniref:hypothetical protein n=1 Tax=Rhabdaerophilum sp. SD176 TaxID=2983548 RepID=UPI0024DF8894|nr:hypothetical protein [Rhabdaerophilum sp. SD176]
MPIRLGSSWPETIYWAIALAMLAAGAITLILMFADGRTLDGHTSVWTKPLKFEISLALHASTIALVCGLFSQSTRSSMPMVVIALLFLAACIVEMSYIIIQGGLGQQSHFNVGTPFHRFMYSVMAFAAVIIVGAAGAIGLMAMSDSGFAASPPLKSAIILGFLGGTVLTLITAFTIGGRLSPFVGGIPDFGSRMVLTGWSMTGGDLRVSHFLATHMIQAIPLAALLVDRALSGRAAVLPVFAFAGFWALLTISEYRKALDGNSSILTSLFR